MSKLERLTHICLIIVCLVSSGLLLEHRFRPAAQIRNHEAFESAPDPEALIGTHLTVRGINWRSSRINAVLFINTHCRFCAESAPFYRKIADALHDHPTGVTISVLSTEPTGDMRSFLAQEHIGVNGVYQVSTDIGLRVTPTLLIADDHGIVRRAFIGELNLSRQAKVLDIVQTGAR